MPRSFEVSVRSRTTVEQVHGVFGDETYWEDRFLAFGTATTLESLVVGADGTVAVQTVQDLRRDALPRLLAKLYPGDLRVLSTETWIPIGDRRVRGEVTVDAIGAPGSGRGAALLQPRGDGSELTFQGTIEFNVPLVGGRVEGYLGRQFSDHITEIQRFTTDWIAQHV